MTFAGRRVRRFNDLRWLGESTGYALASSAPASVFALRPGRGAEIRTVEGRFTVRALGETTALGALPLAEVRDALIRELTTESRAEAYADWTLRRQRGAESRLVCRKDRLPELGVVSLSSFAPFLALSENATLSS